MILGGFVPKMIMLKSDLRGIETYNDNIIAVLNTLVKIRP